jgi:hypothetical protein
VRNKIVSSWAEEYELDNLNESANEYNIPLDLLVEAREVLNRTTKKTKKSKSPKLRKECWQ